MPPLRLFESRGFKGAACPPETVREQGFQRGSMPLCHFKSVGTFFFLFCWESFFKLAMSLFSSNGACEVCFASKGEHAAF